MANKRSPQGSQSQRHQEFYETMPTGAYMDTYDFFTPTAAEAEDKGETNITTLTRDELRRRMLRQGLVMIGLLASQIILFALLIRYTINLG